MECPTKIYYDGKSAYANQKVDDPFLQALASGGFQVGALAKCYFPGGHEINSLDYDEALQRTNELLKMENVIIYEAAVRFENLFIRVDILIKTGNDIELIEVKAKSFDSTEADCFVTKKGSLDSDWLSYIRDAAFQKYVFCSAFPNYIVSSYLMLADKNASCPTDGLNQKFKIVKDERKGISVSTSPNLSQEDIAKPILNKVNVDAYCDLVFNTEIEYESKMITFKDYVMLLADFYDRDEKMIFPLSGNCGKCEYKTSADEDKTALKSGFHKCWKDGLGWTDLDFEEPTILDLRDNRNKDKFIETGRIKLTDLNEDDINVKGDGKPGISRSQRQWLQVQKVQNKDQTYWLDVEGLASEMSKWTYPLHFIDFETSAVAIPFNKGRHPYEGIAFQYSHHVVNEDGSVEHRGQFLSEIRGVFPNYDFVRNLKQELDKDQGSVFRYAAHENTYLNMIYQQLKNDSENIADRNELCDFIRTITKSGKDSDEQWTGHRNMIDMCELVKRYYYDPATNGSNSIKKVLPAILNSSKYLQEKYSEPIYGAKDGTHGIPSLNYTDWKWIEYDGDKVKDPYKLLPNMFQDISEEDLILLSGDNTDLNNGGAALTAYARMQFEEMSEYERQEICNALLKYCELDTLAMVMIYEAWKDWIVTPST
jgi:hypothetical protein